MNFKGWEKNKELVNERDEEGIPGHLEEGNPFCEREMEIPRKEERPRMKRRERDAPWGIEMDPSGGSDRRNMLKSKLGDTKEAHLAVLEDYKSKRM